MAVTREQFEAGMTYDQFKEQMTRSRDEVERNEQLLELSAEDLAAFRDLPRPLKVMVVAEDWCPDVIAGLPVLGRIAREARGTLDVRVLLRDQEPGTTVIDHYLKDGRFRAIPTFVFLDQDFHEVGVFIERPASVTERLRDRKNEIYAAIPGTGSPNDPIADLPEDLRVRVQQAMLGVRDEIRSFSDAAVVRELREIIARVSADTGAGSGSAAR
jgi:hypothetical protein